LFAKNASHFFYRKQKNVIYLFALGDILPKFAEMYEKVYKIRVDITTKII
jgi:hypothetical protein